MIAECLIKLNFVLLLTTKWAGNGAIILTISHYVQLERVGRALCEWSVSNVLMLRKCCEQILLKALGRIIVRLKKGQAWISIFSHGGLATPEVRGLLHMKWRLQVLRVKMEAALVVRSQVGGTDMLPSGTLGLWETMGWLCEAAARESRVTGPLFSGLHC